MQMQQQARQGLLQPAALQQLPLAALRVRCRVRQMHAWARGRQSSTKAVDMLLQGMEKQCLRRQLNSVWVGKVSVLWVWRC
jgi:hypothetical protein